MKSNAPWSVKGIERDARETAKEAAKRKGMTVGEWLNQMIYTAGDPQSSGGEVEGLKLRDIVTAIEHLNKRVADSHAESNEKVGDATRKIGDMVERVQRLERVKPSEGASGEMDARVARLEADAGDRERINALKALEKAVAQVAVQFNTAQKVSVERLDATERQLQEFAERIDRVGEGGGEVSDAGFLKDAIDGLSARITRAEQAAGEAADLKEQAGASIDPAFVESTGNRLRVLGDEIKRSGDQIRTLEGTITKLSGQIDAAERRSAEGVQKVTETLDGLRENFSADSGKTSRADIDAAVAAANKETEARIEKLQNSFETMIERLEAVGETGPGDAAPSAPAAEHDDEDDEIGEEAGAASLAAAFGFGTGDDDDDETDDAPSADDDDQNAGTMAATEDEQQDSDEDPFAFADEIDAALEEEAASDDVKDDFSFELDDEPEAEAQSAADTRAQALLSEVQEVFGKGARKSETTSADEEDDADEAKADAPDDLDQILADLDDMTNAVQPGPAQQGALEESEPEAETDEETPALFGDKAPDEPAHEDSQEDFLGAARQRAKEAEARTDQDKKNARRRLTPKQKAILVARARKKRLAEARGEAEKPVDDRKAAAVKEALQDAAQPQESYDAEESQDADDRGGLSGAFSAFRSKLPFIGTKTEKEETDEGTGAGPAAASYDEDPSKNGERAAFETLKATASARPVTLALAVAIILSVAVLFFLVKDFVFKSPDAANRGAPATSVSDTQGETSSAATDASEALDVPLPPAIDPRALYTDAMAGLGAAENDAETAAAIGKLQEAAALGHPPAQLQLGEFYKTGQGVEVDLGRARTWFRRSANGGNVLAMHRIGIMTARGEGGPADAGEAIGWFELAGNRGLVDSQYNLGAIFHPTGDASGSSVQDAGKAYYWYSLAAKNGDDQAQPLAVGVANALSADQKSELDKSIAEWEALAPDAEANELARTG